MQDLVHACLYITGSLLATFIVVAIQPSGATEPTPIKIAVFDFEIRDASAGGGIIDQDRIDTENLRKSAEMARHLLSDSGLYSIIDTGPVMSKAPSAGGIQHCSGCEAVLAQKLGADRSMVGLITRVNRTEYTLQILVRDSRTGEVLSNDFTGLRMGANYSWPRGTKSLISNKILPKQE